MLKDLINAKYMKKLDKLFFKNPEVCKENRKLYYEFFIIQAKKERRMTNTPEGQDIDLACYKNIQKCIDRIKNINLWFDNKPLAKLSFFEIKKVIDDLQDNKIMSKRGTPHKDAAGYHNKVFKSTLFKLAGQEENIKEYYLANPVFKEAPEVRYIDEEAKDKLVSVVSKLEHKLLLELAFDIGENIDALLKLKKKDCTRQVNQDTKIPEYRINLDKSILKRKRTPRGVLTNSDKTAQFLDMYLPKLQDDDFLFPFEYRNAKRILDRAIDITGIKTIPKGFSPTWKDFRSGMACDLLLKDWHTDEINARLGHKPSSREIDKYVVFLDSFSKKPKQKIYAHNLSKIEGTLESSKHREKLYQERIERMQEDNKSLQEQLKKMQDGIGEMKEELMVEVTRQVVRLFRKDESLLERALQIQESLKENRIKRVEQQHEAEERFIVRNL